MKLKARFLRRVFCVVMCVVILACSSVNTFGAELFETDLEAPCDLSFTWSETSVTNWTRYVNISWVDLNLPTLQTATLKHNSILSGLAIWKTGTSNRVREDELTLLEFASLPSTADGWICYSIPSTDSWRLLTGGAIYNFAAFTVSYSPTDVKIVADGATRNTPPSCGLSIGSSYIYFSPYYNRFETEEYAGNWNSSWECISAHETGHSIGFGHLPDEELAALGGNGSIMRKNIVEFNYNALRPYDISEFNLKYN